MRVKKLGNSLGVGKCPAPKQCKICKCPIPGTDKAGKCPAVAPGWAQVELTDALMVQQFFLCVIYSEKSLGPLGLSTYPPPLVIKKGDFFSPFSKKFASTRIAQTRPNESAIVTENGNFFKAACTFTGIQCNTLA